MNDDGEGRRLFEMSSAMWERDRASRLFALADLAVLSSLAGEVELSEDVQVIQEPETGLVMMEVGDPVSGGSFYIGEVLVTSCQAAIRDSVGCAVVLGDEPERARAAALLDAALQQFGAIDSLLKALEEEERRVEEKRRAEWALVARTRVQFETMGK